MSDTTWFEYLEVVSCDWIGSKQRYAILIRHNHWLIGGLSTMPLEPGEILDPNIIGNEVILEDIFPQGLGDIQQYLSNNGELAFSSDGEWRFVVSDKLRPVKKAYLEALVRNLQNLCIVKTNEAGPKLYITPNPNFNYIIGIGGIYSKLLYMDNFEQDALKNRDTKQKQSKGGKKTNNHRKKKTLKNVEKALNVLGIDPTLTKGKPQWKSREDIAEEVKKYDATASIHDQHGLTSDRVIIDYVKDIAKKRKNLQS